VQYIYITTARSTIFFKTSGTHTSATKMTFPADFKTLCLSSGVTYGYVFVPATFKKRTILFLHGFPSSSYDWRHQISHFSQAGYGVLAPDLLGYGSSDQPQSVLQYAASKMASEIVEIMDYERLDQVHGVGHDWGSFLLSRLANYYDARFHSYSFLDVAYMAPGLEFHVSSAEEASREKFGYSQFGFWKFLIEDDAATLIGQHVWMAFLFSLAARFLSRLILLDNSSIPSIL
jgi:soluble epoxide hydrolase/lipid-phosphate phosphatase